MTTLLLWFARNSVAANLLMGFFVVGGLVSIGAIRQQVFPDLSSNLVSVSVVYRGAAPEEVETAVCARIEERVESLGTVRRVRSVAAEGLGTVTIELLNGTDMRTALDDVKTRIDAIDTFPEETEKPVIEWVSLKLHILSVTVSGPADELTLKRLGERVRDEISGLPGITRVELVMARPDEVSIEISEDRLRRHGLDFDQVVDAIRRSSIDLPGGSVRSAAGEILLRTQGQAYDARGFEDVVLLTRADGTRLLLGDVARVVDGFAETDQAARFDSQPAVVVQVYREGDQHDTRISERVRAYVETTQPLLPEGIRLTVWQDDARILRGRLGTLLANGRAGLVLVLAMLALFLKPRLAFWVAVGIPVSFLGAVWAMPVLGLTIDTVSLLGFLVALGIVVDDAIVVGESVHRQYEKGLVGLDAVSAGVERVAVPVVFSVLTTIAAFSPLLAIPGPAGDAIGVVPLVVMLTLAFSLAESLLVLPSHLVHLGAERRNADHSPVSIAARAGAAWARFQGIFSGSLDLIAHRFYLPALRLALVWRYSTLALALALFFLTTGLVAGGRLKFLLLPPVEADSIVALLTLPQGTAAEHTAATLTQLERAARGLESELVGAAAPFEHVLVSIGEQPYLARQSIASGQPAARVVGSHLGEVHIELAPAERRSVTASELTRRWREAAGPIPDAVEVRFVSSLFTTGDQVDIQLRGPEFDDLRAAAGELKAALARYPGVFGISDSLRVGKREARLSVTPEAQSLGLSLADVGRQVRQAFYGEEAQRIQRGREEIRVMVRYPLEQRRSISSMEEMRIRTSDGDEVPFAAVGRWHEQRGLAAIERTDRQRSVNVTANVDLDRVNPTEIVADVESTVVPGILERYPDIRYSLEGQQRQQQESLGGLRRSFALGLFGIYALLAMPFRSYLQPLVVMSAIPFGIIGALWGHVLMGRDLTIFSGYGIVALSGVVVNDSLVLVDFINRRRRHPGGPQTPEPLSEVLCEAGRSRFRPILLTSITTFAGLVPLLLEKSLQAQFLIPLAISLGFGMLFATLIILFLVPILLSILEDFQQGFQWLKGLVRGPRRKTGAETVPSTGPQSAPQETAAVSGREDTQLDQLV